MEKKKMFDKLSRIINAINDLTDGQEHDMTKMDPDHLIAAWALRTTDIRMFLSKLAAGEIACVMHESHEPTCPRYGFQNPNVECTCKKTSTMVGFISTDIMDREELDHIVEEQEEE
jgi:hypothetical protein